MFFIHIMKVNGVLFSTPLTFIVEYGQKQSKHFWKYICLSFTWFSLFRWRRKV